MNKSQTSDVMDNKVAFLTVPFALTDTTLAATRSRPWQIILWKTVFVVPLTYPSVLRHGLEKLVGIFDSLATFFVLTSEYLFFLFFNSCSRETILLMRYLNADNFSDLIPHLIPLKSIATWRLCLFQKTFFLRFLLRVYKNILSMFSQSKNGTSVHILLEILDKRYFKCKV